ncbi:hypothetical protein A2U01_0024335, partial [Trifolium medium]|nr:hypothetical protein [Trifolium medium]
NVNTSATGNGILFNGKVANIEEAVHGTKRVSGCSVTVFAGAGASVFMLYQHLLLAD